MKMIGHETVREDPHRQSAAGVAQEGDECLKVAIGMKHMRAAIAAIDDVIAMMSDGSPCSPRHGGRSVAREGVVLFIGASTRMRESGQGGNRIGRDEIPALTTNQTGGLATLSDAENQNVPVFSSPG
jgi:hypothetical protein